MGSSMIKLIFGADTIKNFTHLITLHFGFES
jgi:hypothetical protein